MSTSSKPTKARQIEILSFHAEPRSDTVPYIEYVKMKMERNAWRNQAEEANALIAGATISQRIKFLIRGEF